MPVAILQIRTVLSYQRFGQNPLNMKVNLPFSTTERRMLGEGKQLHTSLTKASDAGERSTSSNSLFNLGKENPVANEKDAWWASEALWTVLEKGKFLAPS